MLALLSSKHGKTKPVSGIPTIQSRTLAPILDSPSRYWSAGFDKSTGHIAQRMYSYTSSDSPVLKLSFVLAGTSYISLNKRIR